MIQTIAGAIGLVLGYYAVTTYLDRKSKPEQKPEEKPEPVKKPKAEPVVPHGIKFSSGFYPDELEVIKRFMEDSFLTREKLLELMRDPSVVWVFRDDGGPLDYEKVIFIRGRGMEITLNYMQNSGVWVTKKAEIVQCDDCKWRGTNACFCKAPLDVRDNWFCSEGERRKK